jgi:hypothetical protein
MSLTELELNELKQTAEHCAMLRTQVRISPRRLLALLNDLADAKYEANALCQELEESEVRNRCDCGLCKCDRYV